MRVAWRLGYHFRKKFGGLCHTGSQALAAVAIGLTGCQGYQLKTTTIDLTSIVQTTIQKEVIDNFGRIVEQNYTIPSQVLLTGGTVQIVNTVTPSITFPLSSMFAKTVSATPTKVNTIAGAGASLGGSVSWQENFVVQPIIDPNFLRNASILYNVALNVTANSYMLLSYQVPRVFDRDDRLVPDPYYLQTTNCIFCLDPNVPIPKNDAELRGLINRGIKINDVFTYQWLFCRPDDSDLGGRCARPTEGTRLLTIGSSNGYTFYAAEDVCPHGQSSCIDKDRRKGEKLFADFILLTLPIPSEPTPFSSATKPKKQNGKAGTPAEPRIGGGSDAFRPNTTTPFPLPGIQPNPQ